MAVIEAQRLNTRLDTWRRQPTIIGPMAMAIEQYRAGARFAPLAPRTQADDVRHLDAIATMFGDAGPAAITPPVVGTRIAS